MQNLGPMLNAYPDSLGGTLSQIVDFLESDQVRGAFTSFYILPSLYRTDLDRGFSVIDYAINGVIAKEEDLSRLRALGIDLKLDFILNHLSVQSPQFQDLLKKGDASPYKDFFIDWNKFWAGCGELNDEGVLVPRQEYIQDMFFRKPGLPVLVVEFADGTKKPYWNTFYQQVDTDEQGKKRYLGQMDLNIHSPLVLEFYQNTLKTLAGYGARIVRLDAFAYAPKEVGAKNFLNDPGTWDFLQQITDMARPYQLELLPEIHASYGEGTYKTIAQKGYMVYDFFLPGLVLDAFEERSGQELKRWADEILTSGMETVNMLGCHDGIPLLDLKGPAPRGAHPEPDLHPGGPGRLCQGPARGQERVLPGKRHLLQRPGRGRPAHGAGQGPAAVLPRQAPGVVPGPVRRKERLRRHGAGWGRWPQGDQPHQPERPGRGRRLGAAGGPAAAGASEGQGEVPCLLPPGGDRRGRPGHRAFHHLAWGGPDRLSPLRLFRQLLYCRHPGGRLRRPAVAALPITNPPRAAPPGGPFPMVLKSSSPFSQKQLSFFSWHLSRFSGILFV